MSLFLTLFTWLCCSLPGLVSGLTFGIGVPHLRFASDPAGAFAARKGVLEGEQSEGQQRREQDVLETLTLRSSSGLAVRIAVLHPAAESKSEAGRPAVLLLGGLRTGRRALELLPDSGGALVVALDYPIENPRAIKDLALIPALPRIQRAIRDTPAAILLTLDWLQGRADVDPDRMDLVGVSLGSFFVCIAGALDDRVQRVWAMHGGGKVPRLLDEGLREDVPVAFARRYCVRLAMALAYAEILAPERWVERIAPRTFLQVNGLEDERIPRECIDALFGAAREPKEMIWLPGQHVEPDRETIVRELVALVLARVKSDEVGGAGPSAAARKRREPSEGGG